jgi:hypothetical protein
MKSGYPDGHFHWENKNVLITAPAQNVFKFWGGFIVRKVGSQPQRKAKHTITLHNCLSSVYTCKYVQRYLHAMNELLTPVWWVTVSEEREQA